MFTSAGAGVAAGAAAGAVLWASVTMGVISAVAGYIPACATDVNVATGVEVINEVSDDTAGGSAANTDCSWVANAVPSEDRPSKNCDAKLSGALTNPARPPRPADAAPPPRPAGGTVNAGRACAADCAPA